MHTMVLGPPHQVAQLHIALVNITVIIIAGVHAGIASVTGAIRPVIMIGKARFATLSHRVTVGVMLHCVQDVSKQQPTTPARKAKRSGK